MHTGIAYRAATQQSDFEIAAMLFREYAAELDFDLSFQQFEKELDSLAFQYGHPDGVLILAFLQNEPIGCVGIRKFETGIAELKRMYVRPSFRRLKAGLTLLEKAIEAATTLGYDKIRLDTLGHLTAAIQLYQSNGFYRIEAYRFNPDPTTVYMEKDLQP